jgi:hypothetical protein
LRTALVAVVVAIVTSAAVLYVRYRAFEEGLTRYRDITIGASRKEVLYRLGYPESVLGPLVVVSDSEAKAKGTWSGGWQPVYYTDPKHDPKNSMPDGKVIDDFDEWVYGGDGPQDFTVGFSAGKVRSLTCMDDSPSSTSTNCNAVAGVSISDSEERVRQLLGKPTRYKYDGVAKTISYDDIGLEFVLTKGRVYMITVMGGTGSASNVLRRFVGI